MTLVDRSVRRQLTAAMALAMALALLLGSAALAQTPPGAVEIDTACEGAPDPGFPDIAGNTFEEEIWCLAWYEITVGDSEGNYAPLQGVRRWQMALFIQRLAAYADPHIDPDLPSPSDQGFTDIDALSQEAQDAINVLAEIDVVHGTTETTYTPMAVIRRDQMASFINRLQEWMTGSTFAAGQATAQSIYFHDVPDSNVHSANIDALASVGIVQGKGGGRYDPLGPVTRQEMSGFIVRDIQVNVNMDTFPPMEAIEGLIGEVVDADTGLNWYEFLPQGETEVVRVDYFDNEIFWVDGVESTLAFFETQITPGDTINFIDGGDGPSTHKLTNNVVADGFVGGYNTGANTISVINVFTGNEIALLDYTTANLTVDGTAASEARFENSLNEGDTVQVDDLEGDDETFHLTNGTLSGTVAGTAGGPPPTSVDVELATGAVIDGIVVTGGDSYMVDGIPVLQAAFQGDLSLDDAITLGAVHTAGAREETWTLVNMVPGAVTGLAVDNLAADTFTLVRTSGPFGVDYTVGDVPAGLDALFFVDGVVATEGEFETAYTPGDEITFQDWSEAGDGQDQVLALTNQNLKGVPNDVDTTNVVGPPPPDPNNGNFDVLGPDNDTALDNIAYVIPGDQVFINGAEITIDVEATLEAYLVAIDNDVISGTVEIVPAAGGDPRQIRVTTE